MPGPPEKDVVSSRIFKAAGSETISSPKSLGNGIVSVAAPLAKRLALSVLAFRAARRPGLTKKLAARLSGNWVSVLLYRRCRPSLVDSFFAFGASCELDHAGGDNQIVPLQRKCAQELAMLAAVSPLIFTNVFVWYYSRVYASDSSSRSGAFTWTEVGEHETKNLWRHADKKGSYTKLDSPVRLLLKELVPETELAEDFVSLGPFKSPLLYFDFVQFYGGAGLSATTCRSLDSALHLFWICQILGMVTCRISGFLNGRSL